MVLVWSSPNRQYRGQASPFDRQTGMADGVDTAMDAVKAPCINANADLLFREAEVAQLRKRDDPMSPSCDLGQTHFEPGDFPPH